MIGEPECKCEKNQERHPPPSPRKPVIVRVFRALKRQINRTRRSRTSSKLRQIAFDSVEGGEVAVQFVTQSAAVATPASVLEDYRLSSAGRRFAQAAEYVRAYPRDLPRLKALLPGIKTPMHVLAGRDDPIVPPSNGELLVKHLPHCRHELLEGGHLIWEDAADTYAAQLADWLRGGYRSV
jgi:pimeloyl-ACP methyl ester carboxylesterase